jgi:hypothetical protein
MPRAVTGFVVLLSFAAPSSASCLENVGCTNDHYMTLLEVQQLGCQNLYTLRNVIYRDNGYCFKTARAIAELGNDGCVHDDAGAVPLNAYERANVELVKQVETAKDCR